MTSKVVNERPIRAHYSEGFRGYFDFHRDLVTWQYDEIARLTDESRTHKARADFNFDENERLNTEWCRVVQMMTDNDGEIDRLRAALENVDERLLNTVGAPGTVDSIRDIIRLALTHELSSAQPAIREDQNDGAAPHCADGFSAETFLKHEDKT